MAAPTRRTVLRTAAAVGAVSALGLGPLSPALASARRRVAVLGGGMAGLTAAHELIERGFEVTVYEPRALGGKARSIPVPGTAAGGRRELPGEHGFRFFPGFYHHIPDTMRRIPVGSGTVFDNLTPAPVPLFPRSGGRDDQQLFGFAPDPRHVLSVESVTRFVVEELVGGRAVTADEAAYFASRLLVFMTSCQARRFGQWEQTSWWDFVRAESMSAEYQTVAARGMTRALVAAKEEVASTRTIGTMAEAFLLALMGRGTEGHADMVLNAPTNEAWIDPWTGLLSALGVRFHTDASIVGLDVADRRIAGARAVRRDGTGFTIDADWFITAVPVERLIPLLSGDVLDVDPRLSSLTRLTTDWMNGIQFFLREKVDITNGHVAFVDSPWSLTALTQDQFWASDFGATYGDGHAVDCLSVDISDWDTPGVLHGKPAKECTREEIRAEVWQQMKLSLEDTGRSVLPDGILHSWFLDPAIEWNPGTARNTNAEPLLINTVDSWRDRPEVTTRLDNLFLSGDFVRTNIDLATMESANESGRRAVNALLAAAGSTAAPAAVYPMYEPPEFRAARDLDAVQYAAGLPNTLDTVDLSPLVGRLTRLGS